VGVVTSLLKPAVLKPPAVKPPVLKQPVLKPSVLKPPVLSPLAARSLVSTPVGSRLSAFEADIAEAAKTFLPSVDPPASHRPLLGVV
jgi:hypothetical protein